MRTVLFMLGRGRTQKLQSFYHLWQINHQNRKDLDPLKGPNQGDLSLLNIKSFKIHDFCDTNIYL